MGVFFLLFFQFFFSFVCTLNTGYVIGLTATFLSLNFMRQAQPALLFLVPSILIGVLLTAMISGELCLFLTGRPFVSVPAWLVLECPCMACAGVSLYSLVPWPYFYIKVGIGGGGGGGG